LLNIEKYLIIGGDTAKQGDIITVTESKIKATGFLFEFDETFIELEISDPTRFIRFEDENILDLEII